MVPLSNEDFKKAVRLLSFLASLGGDTLREREERRRARLLLRKWEKKLKKK